MDNLLMVEDDRVQREMLMENLNHDFNITAVEDCASAIEKLTHNQYDVILLDLYLPDSKAHDTVARIKPLCPRAAICVYTGYSDGLLAKRCIDHNASTVLLKGVDDQNWETFAARLRTARAAHVTNQNLRTIAREECGIELQAQVQHTIDRSNEVIASSRKLLDGK